MSATGMYADEGRGHLRSAVIDFRKKSKEVKRLWRKGFSEFYDITDMKPRHVLTFNILFILKRLILAIILVCYKILSGSILTYVLAFVHIAFLF